MAQEPSVNTAFLVNEDMVNIRTRRLSLHQYQQPGVDLRIYVDKATHDRPFERHSVRHRGVGTMVEIYTKQQSLASLSPYIKQLNLSLSNTFLYPFYHNDQHACRQGSHIIPSSVKDKHHAQPQPEYHGSNPAYDSTSIDLLHPTRLTGHVFMVL